MAKAEGTRYLDCGFMVYTKREYRAMDTRFDGYGREVLTKGRTGFGLGTYLRNTDDQGGIVGKGSRLPGAVILHPAAYHIGLLLSLH